MHHDLHVAAELGYQAIPLKNETQIAFLNAIALAAPSHYCASQLQHGRFSVLILGAYMTVLKDSDDSSNKVPVILGEQIACIRFSRTHSGRSTFCNHYLHLANGDSPVETALLEDFINGG